MNKKNLLFLPRIVTYMGHPDPFGDLHPQELLLSGITSITLKPKRRLYKVALIAYEEATPVYLKKFTDDTRYESLAEIRAKYPSSHPIFDAPVLEWDNYLKVWNE